MKRLFSIILMTMLGFMTKAWADNISIESGKIAPNSTKIVSVVLNNTATNYVGFQMDFYLPKGLSIDKSKTTLTDRAESGSSITIGKQSNGAFRLVYSSLNLTPIKGTGGALINLCLKASADYSGGSVMVKNVVFGTTDSKTVRMDNVSFDMQRMTSVTVTANTIKMKYGDAVPELTYQKSDPSVKGTPTLICEATSTSPVGTYPIVISQGSVEADEVKCVNGSLIIEKAPLTISAGNYTKKQGEPMPTFKAVYNGFKNNETEEVLTKKPTITTTATEGSAPGSYPVTVSGAEAQNYEISYQPGTLTVTKADAVIITAKSYSRVYGDNNPTFEYEVQGAQLDGVPEITCEATKGSPVGTYAIVVKQGTVKNYNVTFANGTLTVTKAPLTISAGNYTKKQGEPMPTFKAVYNGFKNNETEEVLTKKPTITTTATEGSAPGSYPVTVSGAEAQNYNISYQPGTLTITNADAVIITARSYSRTYGDNNPTFEYDVQGAQLDGVPEITCEATKNSPVGTYTIVVKQGTVKNYNVTFANGTLTITKAPLTVSAGNYTKKQGDPMPTFKAVYNGFKNNETEEVLTKKPVITTTATESSAPGNYPVTVSGAEAQNYDISYVNGKLIIIKKKHQTITWNQDIQATAGQTVEMTATSSSGLPISYTFYQAGAGGGWPSSDIDGNRITFNDAGARIIIAHQDGDKDYEAAEPDTMYFNVLSADEADGLMYIDGLYYKYADGNQSALKVVRGYKSYMGDIVVPLTANGLPVISLGDLAFYTSDKLNSVVIGDNIKEYGSEALSNSYNIRSITFPRNGNGLPDWLCNSSRGIKEIHCRSAKPYPGNSNVFNLGNDFYQNCTLYVPKGTTDAYRTSELWGKFANIVEEDVVLSKVDAPEISTDNDILNISCDTYGATIYYTLDGTEPSENSRIYTKPVSLSASCYIKTFAKKEGLANSDVVSGEYHNSQYPDIIKVGDVFTANIINNGVDSLPMYFKVTSAYPFEASLALKDYYVKGWNNEKIYGDIEIPSEILYNGTKLKVVAIDNVALNNCIHTSLIKLNEGLRTIGNGAFRYCTIKELVIPNSVNRIGDTFVTNCNSLKTITLGTGLLSFGVDAFWAIPALQNIYSLNPIPPTFDDPNRSFEEMPIDQITLYVPIGSKSAYENAPGWNIFAGRIVEIDPTGIAGVHAGGLSITVSNHRIHVEGAKVGSILNVYDLSGNKCMSVRITSGNADINCTIPNGVYVIRLGNVSKKVVV